MKAAVITGFGPTGVIKVMDVPIPSSRDDEVLVRVNAAGINPKDIFIRKGRFRLFTGKKFPMPTGFDFAGKIVDTGAKIEKTRIDEAVFGMLNGWKGGTCAQYIAVNPDQFTKKPESLSFEEAAALPLVSLTALQALRDKACIKKGQDVCINGAAGGVGSVAVQIAKIYGTTVSAVSNLKNHLFLHDLGADQCIDYNHRNITESRHEFDIFFDVFGNQGFNAVKPVLRDKGVWVSTVVRPHVFISRMMTFFSFGKKARLVIVKSNSRDLCKIRDWVEKGQLKPVIHKVYPLDEIGDAHAQIETKHTRGKIIINI